MNGSPLLTLEHRYEGHWIACPGQHAPESIKITKDSVPVHNIVTIGKGHQVIGPNRDALSSDLCRGSRPGPLFITFAIGRSSFTAFLSWPGISLAPRSFDPLFPKVMNLDRPD
jgi:hypothetical protein